FAGYRCCDLGLTVWRYDLELRGAAPLRTAGRCAERRGLAMWSPTPENPLRRFFAGFTEQTFLPDLGIGDPPLLHYLTLLLSRCISLESLCRLGNAEGKRLEQVADMMIEAEALPPEGRTRREVYRHIGDFTLFWTGVYPEALDRFRSVVCKDHFIDYCAQGK